MTRQLAGMEMCSEPYHFLLCPITLDYVKDPVVASDGHTYERAAIERWLTEAKSERRWPHSPVTLLPLRSTRLIANVALRKAVEELGPVHSAISALDTCAMTSAFHPLLPGRAQGAPPWQPAMSAPAPTYDVSATQSHEAHHEYRLPVTPSSLPMFHIILLCCAALPVLLLLLAEHMVFSLSMGLTFAETVVRALSDCGGALGAPLLFAGVGLCAAGVYVRDECIAVLLVIAGAPLAIASFCHGLAAAKGGDSTSALFLSRCLLVAGFLFCSIGLHLAGRQMPPSDADAPPAPHTNGHARCRQHGLLQCLLPQLLLA